MIGNYIKTAILLGLLTAILLWVGNFFGGSSGLVIALIFSLLINFGSYWFSDKIVLAMYRAVPANKSKHSYLIEIVRELSKKDDLPMPKVYIIPTESSNAFATGRNPKHAAVACTEGILKSLTKEELRGVIAHELTHVKNSDTLIMTIAATIAGVIGYLASMARFAAMFGGGRDREGSNNLIGVIVMAIVAPLMAMIIQLAISRSREYLADEGAAKTVHDSKGLASALEKLEAEAKHKPLKFGNNATSSIFIVNPFSASAFATLFSTHPSTKDRIAKLKSMKF